MGLVIVPTAPRTAAPTSGVDLKTLLERGSRALYVDGDLQSGRQFFDAAYREADRVGDAEALAQAALGLGGLWVQEHRSVAEAASVLARQRHALSLLDPQSSLGLQLRARLAAEADYRNGGHAGILAVLGDVRQAGDPQALASTLSLAHNCLLGTDHGALRQSMALELIGAASRTMRRSDLLMGLMWHTADLFLDADPHAERGWTQLREELALADHLAVGFVASAIDTMLCIRSGRLNEAEALATACAQRGLAAGDIDATGWYGGQLTAIRWYQGRIGELVPMLSEMVHSPTLSAIDNSYFAALAVAAASAGQRRVATAAVARLLGRDLAELPRSSSWLVSMYGLVEASFLLDDAETAAQAYALLGPYAHLPIMASLGVACFGSVHHALGVASLTIGNAARAVDHFLAAVQANLALGHWPATALSRSRLAEALDIADAAGAVMLRKRSHRWEISQGSRTQQVEDCVGMGYLATLLANPGREIRAADLAAGAGLTGERAGAEPAPAQPVLDDLAKRQYRQRLAHMQADIDEFESHEESERAADTRVERDWLVAELAAATGLGGRTRHFPDSDERARVAVGKAIRRALDRISRVDSIIGARLLTTLHTGVRCSYRPE